ncbi:MAG: hypothetical protein GY871_15985, partial [Actinomycetales bacterium]|nr:hypothetical protein [Actinomycetales bacterium]
PKFLNGQFALFLHRNVPHGKDIEDVPVRWDYVSRYLQALTRLGRWRLDHGPCGPVDVEDGVDWRTLPGVGPMHCWYDPGLFDVADYDTLRASYAPQVWRGEYVSAERAQELRASGEEVQGCDVRTAADFREAGFEVRVLGGVDGAPEDGEVTIVDGSLFERWLELEPMRYARLVRDWWAAQGEVTEGGVSGLKVANEEAAVDLLVRIAKDASGSTFTNGGSGVEDGATCAVLAAWFAEHVPPVAELLKADGESVEVLADHLTMEFGVVAKYRDDLINAGTREVIDRGGDAEQETKQTVEELV